MLVINCLYCGPREESEFACGGEAHIARPLAENNISDAEFADATALSPRTPSSALSPGSCSPREIQAASGAIGMRRYDVGATLSVYMAAMPADASLFFIAF